MRILIACLLLLPFSVFAGSVGTTKTFSSGETLTATDLNGNVTALTTAIDDNATTITSNSNSITNNDTDILNNQTAIANIRPARGIYANGILIGWAGPNESYISAEGYLFSVNIDGTILGLFTPYYESATCTGPRHYQKFIDSRVSNGEVFNEVDTGNAVYIPANAAAVATLNYNSTGFPSSCNVLSGTIGGVYLVLPNDPIITGVQNSYTPPFSWGIQ